MHNKFMIKNILPIIILIFLTSCQTYSVKSSYDESLNVSGEKATVYFYAKTFFIHKHVEYELKMDRNSTVQIDSGEYFKMEFDPGSYRFLVRLNKIYDLSSRVFNFDFYGGKTYYLCVKSADISEMEENIALSNIDDMIELDVKLELKK